MATFQKTAIARLSVPGDTLQPRMDSARCSRFPTLMHFLPFISWMRHSLKGKQRSRNVSHTPKGFRTMLAIRNQSTLQIRERLKTTGMGLGLLRLLQDAKRFEEARATLHLLENGVQGDKTFKTVQTTPKVNRKRLSSITRPAQIA